VPPQHTLGAMDYANGELRVRGLALGPDDARNIAAAMKARGYNAAVNGDTLVVTQEAI
jgi:general secretion pathway protein L